MILSTVYTIKQKINNTKLQRLRGLKIGYLKALNTSELPTTNKNYCKSRRSTRSRDFDDHQAGKNEL